MVQRDLEFQVFLGHPVENQRKSHRDEKTTLINDSAAQTYKTTFGWSGQVRSGQVRSGQVRSGQVRSGQVRSGKVRSGQVRSGHAPPNTGTM